MKQIDIKRVAWCSLVALLLVAGCEEEAPLPEANRGAASAGGQAAPVPTAPVAAAPAPSSATTNPASDPAATGGDREQAQAGVGRKGRGYGGGIITEPVRQYFVAQDRITFEIQIPENMKLFQAEHNRYPKDMAEFQRAILEPASIKLPDLPPGDRYVYDAQQHELMVEHQAPGGKP